MKYEIKNLKTFMGMDTQGYNCTLYRDGKKVANVINDGGGGETSIEWLDRLNRVRHKIPIDEVLGSEESLLKAHVVGMVYPRQSWEKPGDPPLEMGMDGYIEQLVSDYEFDKKIKAVCRKYVCFKAKDQPAGTYFQIKGEFTKQLKEVIMKKQGDNLEVIYNEKFGQVAT